MLASIANAVLAMAVPSVCLSVHPSVCPSVTRSTVQFALSDSKLCNQGSTPPLTSSKSDQMPKFVVFLTSFDNKGREVCCRVSLYNKCQWQSCSAINCLSSGINILAGGRPLPPEILAQTDPPLLKAASFDTFFLVAPQP